MEMTVKKFFRIVFCFSFLIATFIFAAQLCDSQYGESQLLLRNYPSQLEVLRGSSTIHRLMQGRLSQPNLDHENTRQNYFESISRLDERNRVPEEMHTNRSQQVQRADQGCDAKFGKTLEENIEKVKSYNLSQADTYLRDLEPQTSKYEVSFKGPGSTGTEIPIIATGASSNHYLESLMMLKNLDKVVRPVYRSIKLYYYDLGLEPQQKEELKKHCNCTVIEFPFEKFPPHVRRLKGYCWKPLIIKMMLQISQFVMWMDASIRLKTAELDPLFKQAKQQGVMMYHNVWSLPAHIHEDTFKFLEESPCLYKNFTEYHAGLILIHSGNSVVNNYIIEPWVKCALIEECMKTKHDEMKILKCPSHTKFHSCHRFDQAILSLLIFRLFHNSFKDHGIAHSYFDICYDQTC